MYVRSLVAFTAASFLHAATPHAADLPVDEIIPPSSTIPDSAGIIALWGEIGFQVTDDDDFENDFLGGIGGDLRYVINGNPIAVQVELGGQFMGDFDPGDDQDLSHLYATGHIFRRNPQSAFGALVSYAATTAVDDGGDDWVGHALLGLEGALFRDGRIYSGQIGVVSGVAGESDDKWDYFGFLRGIARIYRSDTSELEFDLSIGIGDGDVSPAWFGRFTAEYERQFAGSAWSWAVGYEGFYMYEDASGDSSKDYSNHMARLTFSRHFGAQTLYEQAMHGANTFDTPDFALPYGIIDDL